MPKTKHTQGRWTNFIPIRDEDGDWRYYTASAPSGSDVPEAEAYANGQLMGAARDLLDMLDWFTRANSIDGPAGTIAYIIEPEKMAQARTLVASLRAGVSHE